MSFNSNGLLGDDAAAWGRGNREAYRDLFDDLLACNQASQELLHARGPKRSQAKEVVATCLFVRCIHHYAPIVLLLERGLSHSSRALVRVMFEAVATSRAIAVDDEFWLKYIRQDEWKRVKIINKMRGTSSDVFADARELATPELLAEIRGKISEDESRDISVEELARRADLHDWYIAGYTYMSPSVHTSVRDLERHLRFDANGIVAGIVVTPDDRETLALGGTAGWFLCLAADAFATSMQLAVPEKVKALMTSFLAHLRRADAVMNASPSR